MNQLYDFLSGPGAWIAFGVFLVGLALRAAFLVGISRFADKVFWNHADAGWGLRSIGHWLLPLGSRSLRGQPIFGAVVFLFHLCLLGVPVFLLAHNILLEENLGFSFWAMPEALSDWLTVLALACGLFLLVRRLARPEVRILTTAWDYFLLLLTLAPFATGFLAYHQWGDYDLIMVLHLLSAEVLLVVIPFSKLAHVVLFFFSRFFIGSEMGARRQEDGRLGARVW